MSERVRTLIEQLIMIAKSRGISQAQLAKQVGVTAVGLSKAKSRGDLRASTLEELGAQLDLDLVFVPRLSRDKAVKAIKAGAFFHRSEAVDDTEG